MLPLRSDNLTERQREVLNLLDAGESYHSIAEQIKIDPVDVSQVVKGLKDRFHIAGSTDVRLVHFYRESIGDIPDANDPIEGEQIANDVFVAITAPFGDEEEEMDSSILSDRLNGSSTIVFRLLSILGITVGILTLMLFLTLMLRALHH